MKNHNAYEHQGRTTIIRSQWIAATAAYFDHPYHLELDENGRPRWMFTQSNDLDSLVHICATKHGEVTVDLVAYWSLLEEMKDDLRELNGQPTRSRKNA
jgi:hypothetical protein